MCFKKNVFLLSFLLSSFSAYAFECVPSLQSVSSEAENLAVSGLQITSKVASSKVLAVTVTQFGRQGDGTVFVITDEKGDLAGLRVDFKLKTEKNSYTMLKTLAELKNGDSLRYKENQKNPALIVKKSYKKNIYKDTGGEFTFSILTAKPSTYKHYQVYLRKVDGKWKARDKNAKVLGSVDLDPNLDGLSWDGTFSDAYFK